MKFNIWKSIDSVMPANLPPQYIEAEKEYRLAKNTPDKIKALEAMLTIIPRHKGTDKLRGQLRRKISKLKGEVRKKHVSSKKGQIYSIEKEGAAQVVLVGPANVGKSEILSRVTKASPEVADYPFTTRRPLAGMMRFENIQIQLVDTPPVAAGHTEPWVFSIMRNADGLLLVVNLHADPLEELESTFEALKKSKILPVGKTQDDKLNQGLVLKRTLILCNKSDLDGSYEVYEALKDLYGEDFPVVSMSAKEGVNLDAVKRHTFDMLDIIRVCTKVPGKPVDMDSPFVLKRGRTVQDLAERIHKDFIRKFRYAKIWGAEKYKGQMVHKDYVLRDGDIIEFHI